MAVVSGTMIKHEDSNDAIREEFVKILGYVASTCLFLVILFAAIYIFLPNLTEEFDGIPGNFPYSGFVNAMLSYAVSSIGNLFTYVFLFCFGRDICGVPA